MRAERVRDDDRVAVGLLISGLQGIGAVTLGTLVVAAVAAGIAAVFAAIY